MSPQRTIKRALDVLGSTVGLAATAPIMGLAAVAIRATMGGPVLFRQVRAGRDGAPFELVKFRTMRKARAGEGLANDAARLTRLGSFLRSTSIDELPSLLNVLRGEMSLVGPRPLLMEYLPRYSARQARRHDVNPGVTGWAQVQVRNAAAWDAKLELDVWYVENWSLLLDLNILVRTVGKVLLRTGITSEGHATMPEFTGSAAEIDTCAS